MPPKVALIGCTFFVIWLLRCEKRGNPEASLVLWIPTFWLMIYSSRSVGKWFNIWFGIGSSSGGAAEGSAYDRIVLSLFICLAFYFLFKRKIAWASLLKDNFWLILLYAYLLSSVFWSDFPYSSFKRWYKLAATIVIAFLILSENKPLQGLESVFRRCAYVLIPFSLLFIKYFPHYGIHYTNDGDRMGIGVATHKNSLGVLCALMALFLLSAILRKRRAGTLSKNKGQTYGDFLVAGIAVFLLFGGGATYSATSIFIFLVGLVLYIHLTKRKERAIFVANNMKVFMLGGIILFMCLNTILLPMFASMSGRNENLTGRDRIWDTVLEVASERPFIGTGFGGYWGLDERSFHRHGKVNQAHNGYIDFYLQCGILGFLPLCLFYLLFCHRIKKRIASDVDWGVFTICFIPMTLIYNYSETNFVSSSCLWTVFVFLSIVPFGLYTQRE